MTDRPTTNLPKTNLTPICKAGYRACGCPWSRRFATARSTSLSCAGWSGTTPAARSTA